MQDIADIKSISPIAQFLDQVGAIIQLGVGDTESLTNSISIITLPVGVTLLNEGEQSFALYFLCHGRLKIFRGVDTLSPLIVGEVNAGQWVGELPVLLDGKCLASVQALEESSLICIPKDEVSRLNIRYPDLNSYFVEVAQENLRRLKFAPLLWDFFGSLELHCISELQQAAEWVQIHRGDCLFHQGELGNSLYFVVSGRLNAVVEEPEGTVCLMLPFIRGEVIGEMSFLTQEPRSASIYSIRDSVLVRYDFEDFRKIIEKYPQLSLKLAEHLANRIKQRQFNGLAQEPTHQRTAVLGHDSETPLREFAEQLADALSDHGSVLHLSRRYLVESLGFSKEFSFQSAQDSRFQLWLEERETEYKFILFEADITDTAWTKFCIGQADRLLWVARGDAEPSLNLIEQQLQTRQSQIDRPKQILVLIHPSSLELPSRTIDWLTPRTLDTHHHVRWAHRADIERVARFLANRAIGIVLGGGGGRGAAHIGVMKALEEANIPVDFIGGTSVGALMGAQFAMGWSISKILEKTKKMLIEKNPFRAYTMPIVSLIDRTNIDWLLQTFYADVQIEDLWLNFFCVSTNLSLGKKMIHRQGSLWKACRSTSALPGVFVPFIDEGCLLIDGGVLDNDPTLIMRELNPGPLILSSCSKQLGPKVSFTYEELPSTLKFFWRWINPWSQAIEFPNLADILRVCMGINSLSNCEESFAVADIVLIPPVTEFGLFDLKSIDEIFKISYEYASEEIRAVWPLNRKS